MSGFASTVKLGPAGKEMSLTGQEELTDFEMFIGPVKVETDNMIAERSVSLLRRFGANFRVEIAGMGEAKALGLATIAGLRNQELAFIFADAWKLPSEEYTLATTTTFTMKSNPFLLLDYAYNEIAGARQVNLTGVWTDLSLGAHTGTNRIPASPAAALNRSTWVVTLESAGTAGDVVYVEQTITGALVYLKNMVRLRKSGRVPDTGEQAYDVALDLTGV